MFGGFGFEKCVEDSDVEELGQKRGKDGVGVGLDGEVLGSNPQLLLRWSNDGGATWTPEINIPAGRMGDYAIRAYWNRNGYGRDRVYWLRCADPVFWSIVSANLDFRVCAS